MKRWRGRWIAYGNPYRWLGETPEERMELLSERSGVQSIRRIAGQAVMLLLIGWVAGIVAVGIITVVG